MKIMSGQKKTPKQTASSNVYWNSLSHWKICLSLFDTLRYNLLTLIQWVCFPSDGNLKGISQNRKQRNGFPSLSLDNRGGLLTSSKITMLKPLKTIEKYDEYAFVKNTDDIVAWSFKPGSVKEWENRLKGASLDEWMDWGWFGARLG
jgi:hypothetical protein